jgi:serine/threonine protein kinase
MLPPEAAEGETRNSSADIWALGCVFLEMVAVLKRMTRAEIDSMVQTWPVTCEPIIFPCCVCLSLSQRVKNVLVSSIM